jgi:hypothetical protein
MVLSYVRRTGTTRVDLGGGDVRRHTGEPAEKEL